MSFLYLFDLMDFDEHGKVKEAKGITLSQARSNFLYLVSKYNQKFLKEKNLPVPSFFKEELSGLLTYVEMGRDYELIKKKVLSACLPRISALSNINERELIFSLNSQVTLDDLDFADKFKDIKNTLQLEYIMTTISGKIYDKIFSLFSQPMTKENKSKLYKEIINYNALVSATSKVREENIDDKGDVAG